MSLVTRLFAQPNPPHNLIAPNQRLTGMRFSRAISLLMAVSFSAFFLLFVISSLVDALVTSNPISWPWSCLFPALIFFFPIGLSSLMIHYWKRIDPWRFAAALGDERLLADEQPEPKPDALPMPATISISPMIERRMVIGYLIFCLFLITLLLYLSLTCLSFSLPWFWSLPIALLADGLFMLPSLLIIRQRYPMEVSQEGIRFRMHSKTYVFMFWHEARLFACYPEPGPWHDSQTIIYELSSASLVVYWTWMRSKNTLDFLAGPALPFEDHQAQMQALSELVAAKTGLPLYDLGRGQRG